MKLLPSCKLNTELFDKITELYPDAFVKVDDISDYKRMNYYDNIYSDDEYLLCKQEYIEFALAELTDYTETTISPDRRIWRQYICRVDFGQASYFIEDITPVRAKAQIYNELHKLGFNNEDIDRRLDQFTADKSDELGQMHDIRVLDGKILRFDNCVYYDINKAHSDALGEIFPELKPYLKSLAIRSKQDPKLKAIPNYFVGLLAYKTKAMRKAHLEGRYEGTYNWIVQRTTKTLMARINEVSDMNKSIIVYANTDGVVIQNPTTIIPSSNELGEFKIETTGTFYTMHTKGGNILQYVRNGEVEIKSNIKHIFRNEIDLSKGISIRTLSKDSYEVIKNIEIINFEGAL